MVMISILDQTLIFDDTSAAETIQESVILAQAAERLGYQRFWVVEYHNCGMIASASPEILLAAIGAHTSRLRIGAGAILLTYYSPLKLAENFHLLEALYPGRIDLGIGRNMGSLSHLCRQLLNPQSREWRIENYTTKAQELMCFLDGTFPVHHPYQNIPVVPEEINAPEIWMMSSHEDVALVAGMQGLPFCLVHFVTSTQDVQIVDEYRQHFQAGRIEKPHVAVAVQVFCADSEEEALDLSQRYCLLLMKREREKQEKGLTDAQMRYPSAQELAHYRIAEQDRALPYGPFPIIVGNPYQVKEQLEQIVACYDADELMLTTIFPDVHARLHSYELLAEAFALTTPSFL
ncbi:MAG: MsnO8 family LLM class oxidoreductase [Ktedonobacteraceae bacterium]|nr:MsnO8 family LLM class oxidoreductase [Ktedonobacteraceae bacterium]